MLMSMNTGANEFGRLFRAFNAKLLQFFRNIIIILTLFRLLSSDSFDHVLVDMNQILHVVLRRSRNRDQAMKSLMVELDILIGRCKPVQSLVLAIDGSPAAAKLATQRKRRFAILKNTQFKMENFDKLRMSKKKRAKRMRNYKAELQSLELTPGTECMRTMESALLYWSWQRLHSQGKSYSKLLPQVRIYISSSQVPGEGEYLVLWLLVIAVYCSLQSVNECLILFEFLGCIHVSLYKRR